MRTKKTNNIFSSHYPSGIVFVGTIIVGVAVGMLKHKVGPYSLLGIGSGFILTALVSLLNRNKFLDR